MSVILGIWLQEFELDWFIIMVEQMFSVVEESLNGWNNVGIGYVVLMELNYMLQIVNGINIDKVVDINEVFYILCQFWVYQVMCGVLNKLKFFINSVLYMSFVWGEDNVNFLCVCYVVLQ